MKNNKGRQHPKIHYSYYYYYNYYYYYCYYDQGYLNYLTTTHNYN